MSSLDLGKGSVIDGEGESTDLISCEERGLAFGVSSP